MAKLIVTARIIPDGDLFVVTGRNAWAMMELLRAGPTGCTPIDNPGPRWSAYVFNLKREYGLLIETVHEGHRGQFPGSHARYILRSNLEIIARSDELNMEAA